MASGRIVGDKTLKYSVIIEWESVANPSDNTSTLTVRTYITYYRINIRSRDSKTWVDGVERVYTTPAIEHDGSDKTQLVNTRVETIEHNADGTRSVELRSEFKYRITSETTGEFIYIKSAEGTAVLDDIPQNSAIASLTDRVALDQGGAVNLTVSRRSDSYWHKAAFSYAGLSAETDPFETQTAFAPDGWREALEAAGKTEDTAAVSVQTYSDEACTGTVGEPAEAQFGVYLAGDPPVLNPGWVTAAVKNPDGVNAAITVFVQGYSWAELTFDTSKITCSNGAQVKAIRAEALGQELTGSPLKTPVFKAAGTVPVKLTVTDTLGRASEEMLELTVYEYAQPTLSGVEIYRSDSKAAADDGTYIAVRATASCSSCGGTNSVSMSAQYKKVDTWYGGTLQNNTLSLLGGGGLDPAVSYDVRIIATDLLGAKTTVTRRIPTASVVFNLKEGGKGAAFGKYAETENLLESAWPVKVDGDLYTENITAADIVLERRTDVDGSSYGGNISAAHSQIVSMDGGSMRLTGYLNAGGEIKSEYGMKTPEITVSGTAEVKNMYVLADESDDGGKLVFASAQGNSLTLLSSLSIYGKLEGGQNYSTEAVDTGNMWIDGKNIFRQTFTASVIAGSDNEIQRLDGWSAGVQNSAMVIDMHGMLYGTSGDGYYRFYPLNMYPIGSNYNRAFVDNQGHIWFHAAYAGTVYITVFFTKPT